MLALLAMLVVLLASPLRDSSEVRPDLGALLSPARRSPAMQQRIILGDCLDVFANERNVPAFVSDPPANIAFMGRSWDRAHPVDDYVLPCTPRSKAHDRELRSEESFIRYWSTRYAMGYDIADQHATAIIWTLPRTSYQTATALRRAGWDIKDNLVHLFGTGWAKTGNALAPGQESWLLCTKGKPDLDIDACRVPRGGSVPVPGGKIRASRHFDGSENGYEMVDPPPGDSRGSLPKNALLSHCEECVRVGSRDVKGTPAKDNRGKPHGANKIDPRASLRDDVWEGFGATESVPAWHCLAGCVCGARSKWDPEKPLPRCPCGETWRWLCAVAEVNAQSGNLQSVVSNRGGASGGATYSAGMGKLKGYECGFTDSGGASRFFNTFSYLSKCSSSERHAGCENLYWRANKKNPFGFDRVTREEWERLSDMSMSPSQDTPRATLRGSTQQDECAHGNVHPTVKSYRLMHWLHSLTGAKRILDFTAGSGTGMLTAAIDGIEWLGAEICPEAITIAQARHAFWTGLSHEARRAMVEESVVPSRFEPDERQRSLF